MPGSIEKKMSTSVKMELLQELFPITGLLYVGAGRGKATSARIHDLQVERALLVEANPEYRDSLEQTARKHDGWLTTSILLGPTKSARTFYHASNPMESGMISPLDLLDIWPNLAEEYTEELQQTSIDSLLDEPGYNEIGSSINTVVIDCLPALPVLQGAGQRIANWEILQVRVVTNEIPLSIKGASLTELNDYLEPLGFRCIAVTSGNHPAIAEALYLRDWRKSLLPVVEELQKSRDEQIDYLNDRERQLQILNKDLEAQGHQLEEKGNYIGQLKQERDEKSRQLEEHKLAIENYKVVRDKQKELLEHKERMLERIAQYNDEKTTNLEEKAKLVEELTEERGRLEKVLTDKTSQFKELEKQWDEKALGCSQEITNLQEVISNQQSEIQKLNQDSESLQENVQELTGDRDRLEKVLADKTSELSELDKQWDEKVQGESQEITRLQEVIQNQQAETQKINQDSDSLQQKIEAINVELSERLSENAQLNKTINEYKQKVDQLEKEIDNLESICNNQAQLIRQNGEKLEAVTSEKSAELHKLRLLDEEIVKSRSQLDFIKGILFDGKK